ncbi:hypothetical protein [Actinomyces sp.]|uniref:hypothetical protein n=1 Tax=Actinomyces sp. TaxID=29317 RepID=UPI0026DD4FF1|nr:hypothetical protein [Actinomyces sp.]MDO4899971.1 hypothetical protein [Actinomyces sp.]
MNAAPRPVPPSPPGAARDAVPELAARLEAVAELPLEERAAQLAAIRERLSSDLRQTEN